MTGPQLRLILASCVSFAAPVKIEARDLLLLGDVCHCEPCEEGYAVGITTRHMLPELSELRRLNRALKESGESWEPAGVRSR